MANTDITSKHLLKNRVVLHGGFWVVFFLLGLLGELESRDIQASFFKAIHLAFHYVGFAGVAYLNLYVLIPKYFITKKYGFYSLFLLGLIGVVSVVLQLVHHFLIQRLWEHDHSDHLVFMFFHVGLFSLVFVLLTTFFYFLRRWIRLQDVEIKLRKTQNEKVNAELKALKAQINPHFLFNSLNNIYSLTLENNPKAPEVILKLSDLLSYVLYDCQSETIALKKELAFVRNYVEVEKSRFEDGIEIDFSIEGEPGSLEVGTLIFIPFIENAFKHMGSSDDRPPRITILFNLDENAVIRMRVTNSIATVGSPKEKGGVGLDNVRKRLALLYPRRHSLEIQQAEESFCVEMVLRL